MGRVLGWTRTRVGRGHSRQGTGWAGSWGKWDAELGRILGQAGAGVGRMLGWAGAGLGRILGQAGAGHLSHHMRYPQPLVLPMQVFWRCASSAAARP